MSAPGTARILVVDDSLTIRRALELILKPLGHALDFAADGAQALERAAAFDPELILLDYVLPDMRAPDVCAALAASPSTALTPIILVSAKGASIRQAYQDAQNVVSYITKPFKPQVVASVVENALLRARPRTSPSTDGGPRLAAQAATFSRKADHARSRGEASAPSAPPESVEQAFAALLAQLEGAICEDPAGRAGGPAARGSFPGVSPRLRHAADRLGDIAQHLSGEAVLPYRVREDGSFANVAATLLEAHRYLCEAAILLAATGAPSASLPRTPDVLVVCPRHHALHDGLVEALRAQPELTPLLVSEDFTQLPHLVRLLGPRAVVAVRGDGADLEAAVRCALDVAVPETRFVALVGDDATGVDPRFAVHARDLSELGEALRDLVSLPTQSGRGEAPGLDLEVVAL